MTIQVVSRAERMARLAPVPRGQKGSIRASPTSATSSLFPSCVARNNEYCNVLEKYFLYYIVKEQIDR